MENFNEEEWENIALVKEAERKREIQNIERMKYLASIPFHKRLQEKGEEERLTRWQEISQDTFKKKFKDLGRFEDYWKEFVNTGISINQWEELHTKEEKCQEDNLN